MSRILTYQFRIKDSKKGVNKELLRMASSVNTVWNFCNDLQKHALKWNKKWPGKFDFSNNTSGSSKELGLHSQTVQCICEEYYKKRKQFKKSSLRWRSYKTHLPWIPFKASGISINSQAGEAKYCGLNFKYFNSRLIVGKVLTGSICADARGRFYLNVTCELPGLPGDGYSVLLPAVGVDLGLKDAVTTSEGLKKEAPRYYRKLQNKLATAQRARKKKQTRNIHAKIKNQRKDFNHKLSLELTQSASAIVVGGVSSSKLAKTNMAKSVYDVSWFQLKSFIKYKASARRIPYLEVNEAYSTQTCSECGCIPASSPKGIEGLSIREWVCSECGSIHDRDINAAKNILRFGRESLTKLSLISRLVLPGIPYR